MSERQRPPGARPVREPIHAPWLWVALGVVLLVIVPWWAPGGVVGPIVAGVPAWFLVSVIASLAFSGLTCWACLTRWNVVEDEEERAGSGRTDGGEGGR